MRSQRAVPGSAGRHVHFLTSFSSFLLSFSPARAASNQQQPQSVKHSWTSAHGRILASDMTGYHSRFAIAESVIATPSPPSEGCRATALSSSVQGPPDCGAPAAVTPTVDCGLWTVCLLILNPTVNINNIMQHPTTEIPNEVSSVSSLLSSWKSSWTSAGSSTAELNSPLGHSALLRDHVGPGGSREERCKAGQHGAPRQCRGSTTL